MELELIINGCVAIYDAAEADAGEPLHVVFSIPNRQRTTIDAVPVRHAHWVFRDEDKHLLEDGCIPCNMWCSYCGQWSDNDSYGDAYCHNCGSRMDEPDLADEIAKEMIEDAGTG